MKVLFLTISSFLLIHLNNRNVNKTHGLKDISADSIILRMSSSLNSLKNISYKLDRELNYSSENYHNKTSWSGFYDFQSADTIIGFRYQVEDSTLKQIFNGTEKFTLDKKARTMQLNEQPNEQSFGSFSPLYNSIITLKNVLPLIINDKTITKTVDDTTIADVSYYLITLNLNKRRIQNLGKDFDLMKTKSNFIYKIIIDKKNHLPSEVLQVNDVNSDFIKTSFKNINTSNPVASELSWYYSTYTNDYKLSAQKELPQLIPAGSDAPGWILPLYNKNESIALKDLKGKIVLLDFWIKNCGPCIRSVPDLNVLEAKFKNKNLEILSINSYDTIEDINWFCNKHKPIYKVLVKGKAIAEKYGVQSFPTVILLDKEGKVLFSGGFEKSAIEKLIDKAL